MGNFNNVSDDDAELLAGGANPSTVYTGSNYGQFKKSGGVGPNPGSVYGGTNYGQSKK
ncbi:MAG: hypothetical protein VKK62_04350 [Synechococcaceae cyanobacterium]|nr:hypothetical protein [Synechococcaceae cyanobacterium]